MGVPADHDPQVSRSAYWAETVPSLRQRLTVAMALFVLFMGIGTFAEITTYPGRRRFALLLYGVEVLIAVAGASVCWPRRLRDWSVVIAAATTVAIAACICVYHGHVAAPAERVATVLWCVLNLLSVLMPWGWAAQAATSLVTLASFIVVVPDLVTNDTRMIPGIVLAATATTSVCAAFFLDRYRFEAFRRSALQTEEAEIAATLAHAGETLSRHLGQPGVLDQVSSLAMQAVHCDWSVLFLFDDRRDVYWLASNVGARPELRELVGHLEFPSDSLPILRAFTPGQLITIPDAARQSLVPPDVLHRFDVASALYAPVSRGDAVIGVLVTGYTARTGPFSSRQQRLLLGIAHATAITLENSRLIADLQTANRLKSEFVATMSHELRTPLNVIMGYTEMLADRAIAAYGPQWNDTVDRIQENAVELLDLVSATLDLGRLESGRETLSTGPVDVERMFAELARELEPLVSAAVALSWRNEIGSMPIMTDGAKLKTIVKNLAANALKFTSQGTVDVTAIIDAGLATVTVRDTGIGIAAEHLPVIFDMFRQVDSSSTRRFGGVGLGLHIARRLVELLGGRIEVASTPGAGSTFTVIVPAHGGDRVRPLDREARPRA